MAFQIILFTVLILVLTFFLKKLNFTYQQKKIIYIGCFILLSLILVIQKF